MDVRNLVVERNSEEDFVHAFMQAVSAACAIIHIRTQEIGRVLEILRRRITIEGDTYEEWDIVNGIRTFTTENVADPRVSGDNNGDIHAPLERVWARYKEYHTAAENDEIDYATLKSHFMVLVNPQYFWERTPVLRQRFLDFGMNLPLSSMFVVMVCNDMQIPDDLAPYVVTIDFDRPGHAELESKARVILESLDEDEGIELTDDEIAGLAVAGAGMTRYEFETAVSRSIIAGKWEETDEEPFDAEKLMAAVRKHKTEVVKRSDLLELMNPEDISHVGGMENLKKWVSLRSACYSDEARAFGIEPPKGLVLVGVPGTGKSLVAKAIASEFGIPLVRLDFSRVFNALVGSSEQRMRTALSMVEAMAPCVCFADEVDKGLGGIMNGGGDAGTSMRVLGTFLTWLQESKAPVFTMVTANNINGLPPELLRRGRFDAIFSTTLPSETEREEVLRIHLDRRGWDISGFSESDIRDFLDATAGFVPAEIEAAVKDGLVLAFHEKSEAITMEHLLEAVRGIVPLSKSHGPAIEAMVEWAANNAIPASYTDEQRRRLAPRPAGTGPGRGGRNNVVRRLDTRRKRKKD